MNPRLQKYADKLASTENMPMSERLKMWGQAATTAFKENPELMIGAPLGALAGMHVGSGLTGESPIGSIGGALAGAGLGAYLTNALTQSTREQNTVEEPGIISRVVDAPNRLIDSVLSGYGKSLVNNPGTTATLTAAAAHPGLVWARKTYAPVHNLLPKLENVAQQQKLKLPYAASAILSGDPQTWEGAWTGRKAKLTTFSIATLLAGLMARGFLRPSKEQREMLEARRQAKRQGN